MALTPRDIAGFGGPYPGRLDEEPIDPAALPAVDVDVTTRPDVTRMPDGALTLTDDVGVMDFDPDAPEPPLEGAEAHDANLAEFLAPDALSRLANEIAEEAEADLKSREPWVERVKLAFELLGLAKGADPSDKLFPRDGAQLPAHR